MTDQPTPSADPEGQAMLECLRETVAKTLERKHRLGQYAVIWENNAPVAVGEDAPQHLQTPHSGD